MITKLNSEIIFLNESLQNKFFEQLTLQQFDPEKFTPVHFEQIAYKKSRLIIELDAPTRDLKIDWMMKFLKIMTKELHMHYSLKGRSPAIYVSKLNTKIKSSTGCSLHIIVHLDSTIAHF